MTGNPVECVLHPELWNKSRLWEPSGGVGRISSNIIEDQYDEENYGYSVSSVRRCHFAGFHGLLGDGPEPYW